MADPPNHFFKFIPPGFNFNLSIPKSFLWNLDGWTSREAILRRGSHKWPVEISDEGVFSDGWRDFVVDNEVQELDIIVFKHQGNMVFDFFVFDQSTCERQYPNLLHEVEDSLPESDSLHTHKRSKTLNKRKRTNYSSRSKDGPPPDDDRCFVTTMTPYSIQTSEINVPIKFARLNGLTTIRMSTQVIILDEAKSTWPATLQIKTNQICLTGWHNLIIAYDLRVGDTCMFELVKAKEVPVFNLCIKPTNNHIQVMKETSNSTCYYISTLKPYSCYKWSMYLPTKFSRSNALRMGEMILRDDKGRSWKVQLNKNGENRLSLGCGFKDFVIGNGFREGDAYKFELLENEKDKPPIVNFSYLGKKAIKDRVQFQKTSSKIKKVISLTLVKKEKGKPPVMKETSKILNKRKRTDYLSQSKHELQLDDDTCFLTIMTPYHIREAILKLPLKFARSNGLTTRRMHAQVILVDESKRTWPATLQFNNDQIRLTGWRNLIRVNDLRVGDTCKLELIKAGEVLVFNFYNLGKKPTNNSIQVKKETSLDIQKATSSNRYFISTLTPYSCERSILYLPAEFSISNGLRTGKTILRDDKGRSWNVQLNKQGKKQFYLGCGFRDLLVANELSVGDTYKFELVVNEKDKPLIVNFSCLRKMAVKKHKDLQETSSSIKKVIGSTVVKKKKKKGEPQHMKVDVDSTPSKIEGRPYYNGEVKAYYLKKSMLYLPSNFARKNGLFNKEKMILKDDNERSWNADIKCFKDYCYIGAGWNELCAANGLKERDLFKLELVSNGEIPVANFYVQQAQ